MCKGDAPYNGGAGELRAECVSERLRFLMIFRIFYCFRGNLHCRPAVRLSPDSCILMDFMNSGIRNHRLALISHIPEARCMSFPGFWVPDLLTFMEFMIVGSRLQDFHWFLVFWDPDQWLLLDSGVQILWFSWISCLCPPDLKICMDFFDTGIHIH